jgi:phosphoribosylformylglycinamidine synthase PurS subunit
VYHSRVRVTLRPSILDPQGKAVEHAIENLNVGPVSHVRIGKYVEFLVDEQEEDAARRATEAVCRKLLANPVMEDFSYELTRV